MIFFSLISANKVTATFQLLVAQLGVGPSRDMENYQVFAHMSDG